MRKLYLIGLDGVEIVLRCEEVFEIYLSDEDVGATVTVGDLYRLICKELNLPPGEHPTEDTGFDRLPRGTLNLTKVHWNPEDVWATLVAIFVDQQQLDAKEITYTARINADLGVD